MSLKTKLTSLITTFVLLCSLLTVGVFAVKNTTFNVGGDIVFNVQGIEAEVKLEELTNASLIEQTYNIGAETDKLKTFELDNDMTASQVQACYESWAGLDMKFDSEADVLLKIRITNKTEIADNLLKVDMSATFGSANNCTISVDKATATINPGDYEIFTITFSITNKEFSANIENFAVNVNMSQAEPFKLNIEYDEENNYYYLEMGTYGGSPVRWRYVSDVTNGIDTAVRFAPTAENAPVSTTGSKGMFILESDIFTADTLINGRASTTTNDGIVEFLPSNMYKSSNSKYYHTTEGYTDVYANDYAASNLRAFLTGRTNVAGQDVGNLMNVIGIDSNNAIYQKIQGRTLTDLYSSINEDSSTLTLPTQFEGTITDMFWSLSYNEALTILGGGDTMQNELLWKSPAYYDYWEYKGKTDESWMNAYYWLRSPNSSATNFAYNVDLGGGFSSNDVNISRVAARPAFVLEF